MTAIADLIRAVEAGLPQPRWKEDGFVVGPVWVAIPFGIFSGPQLVAILDAYNGSLDAALALHEALLPGWEYRVSPGYAIVLSPDNFYGAPRIAFDAASAYNPSRSWLLAILRAVQAQEKNDD